MRAKNLALTSAERNQFANEVFTKIESSEIFAQAKVIALFSSLADELPTQSIINRWATQKRILLPRVEENFSMEFYEYSPAELSLGSFGILEPSSSIAFPTADIDIIIVPGVAFTTSAERLGRGKGYYDRFLSRGEFRAHTIGVCYNHQICDSLPTEEHDIPLDEVIFPL